MARGGINFAIVKEARDALIARGVHPSIDAVRVELGNTGSKSTIHRYLKELEQSDPSRKGPVSLSDELAELVARIADRLDVESEERVENALAVSANEQTELQKKLEESEAALAQLQEQFNNQQRSLDLRTEELTTSQASLQSERTRNAGLSQAVADFELRLQDKSEQIRSLEEKHLHARDALEHYRNSVRDQREQEQRRHEGQVQQIQLEVRTLQATLSRKQDEITTLNRDNERLLNEIRQLSKTAHELENQKSINAVEIDALKTQVAQGEGGVRVLSNQVTEMQERIASLTESLNASSEQVGELKNEIANLKGVETDSAC